jgi:hypothetical protein
LRSVKAGQGRAIYPERREESGLFMPDVVLVHTKRTRCDPSKPQTMRFTGGHAGRSRA